MTIYSYIVLISQSCHRKLHLPNPCKSYRISHPFLAYHDYPTAFQLNISASHVVHSSHSATTHTPLVPLCLHSLTPHLYLCVSPHSHPTLALFTLHCHLTHPMVPPTHPTLSPLASYSGPHSVPLPLYRVKTHCQLCVVYPQ